MTDDTVTAATTDDAALLRSIRDALARVHQISGPSVRSQHPKAHGVVQATFQVHELPLSYRVGIFASARPIAAWIRFSNGRERDDRNRDVRGMAIKLLNVPGETVAPDADNASSQDFVLADHPVFFARDARHFLQFLGLKGKHGAEMKTAVDAGASPAEQAALTKQQQLEVLAAFPVAGEFFKTARSPLTLTYFSQTPYRFGERSVKYFVRPERTSQSDPVPDSADALRDSMLRVLTIERTAVRFEFGIQMQTHPALMPIDDATVEWKSAEEVVLATITVPPQDFASEERQAFGEALSFSPWHSRPAHEPVGSINRARREPYVDSSATRHDATRTNRQAPTESDFNALTLSRFFECFRRGDVPGMQLCLHPHVEFRDIGFDLRGREVAAMWHLIVSKGIDVSYRDLHVGGQAGTAHWECDYEFRKDPESQPRPVHNVIDSKFGFEGGLIRLHEDTCDFWTWFEQALGPIGKGAHVFDFLEDKLEQILKRDVPLNIEEKVRDKVRATARGKITAFILEHPEYRGNTDAT
jgi:hypothetical protein